MKFGSKVSKVIKILAWLFESLFRCHASGEEPEINVVQGRVGHVLQQVVVQLLVRVHAVDGDVRSVGDLHILFFCFFVFALK